MQLKDDIHLKPRMVEGDKCGELGVNPQQPEAKGSGKGVQFFN